MSRRLHAICPVQHFDAAKWQGWTVAGKELITHPALLAAANLAGNRSEAAELRAVLHQLSLGAARSS